MKTNVNLSKILTPEELQWFGQWLSKSQMKEGIKSHPGASHSVIFNVLEAAPAGRRTGCLRMEICGRILPRKRRGTPSKD